MSYSIIPSSANVDNVTLEKNASDELQIKAPYNIFGGVELVNETITAGTHTWNFTADTYKRIKILVDGEVLSSQALIQNFKINNIINTYHSIYNTATTTTLSFIGPAGYPTCSASSSKVLRALTAGTKFSHKAEWYVNGGFCHGKLESATFKTGGTYYKAMVHSTSASQEYITQLSFNIADNTNTNIKVIGYKN